MKRIFIVAALICMLASPFQINAQVGNEPYKMSSGLGVAIGMVSGYGFSYRAFPTSGPGVQITSIYMTSGGDGVFSLGVQPLLILKRTHASALYIPFGVSVVSGGDETNLAGGLGLGVSWRRFGWWPKEQFWTSCELMMTAYNDWFLPIPQVSIHYLFD